MKIIEIIQESLSDKSDVIKVIEVLSGRTLANDYKSYINDIVGQTDGEHRIKLLEDLDEKIQLRVLELEELHSTDNAVYELIGTFNSLRKDIDNHNDETRKRLGLD